jgi:hypothetical protein
MEERLWTTVEKINGGEKLKYSVKSYPSVTLYNTNPTWTALGLKPGLHGEKLVTNRLS